MESPFFIMKTTTIILFSPGTDEYTLIAKDPTNIYILFEYTLIIVIITGTPKTEY